MTDRTMARHMAEAIRIKAEIDALKKELVKHQDAIKAEIVARNQGDTLAIGGHKAIWRPDAVENRFNSRKFKSENSDIYNLYCEPTKRAYWYLA